MKNIFLLLMIFSVSLGILFEVPTFCQEISGEICGLPEESLISKGTTAYSWPYYPKDATLKALVIFVKFRDDNVDIPPHTDLWPHDLAGLPSWTPNIISSSVLPSYSNPSISGYFDEMSMGHFNLSVMSIRNFTFLPMIKAIIIQAMVVILAIWSRKF